MKIRDRLAINFTLIGMGMLLVVLSTVYLLFQKFLEADFYERLADRTMVTAKLYLEADEISREALNKVRGQYLNKLRGEVIRIYDSANKATFISDGSQYWSESVINSVRKQGKVQFADGQYQVVGIFYKDNQGDFVIIASAADQSSISRLGKLFRIMLTTFVLISLILLISGRWIAGKLLHPLNKFIAEVKNAGSGKMDYRVHHEGKNDEISLLAGNFNQLMDEIEQSFILQKTFVDNASHELRTPITSVIMTSELILSKEREKEDYQKAFQSVLEDTSKMDNTITGLLALAKMDLELAGNHLVPVRLDELLISFRQEWKEKHNLDIHLTFEEMEEIPVVMASYTLLEIAVKNVISNAFKFSDGQVDCILENSSNRFLLHVTDQGIGIPEAEQSEIFKPYYTRSQHAGKSGEGMGLYMASKIIGIFRGEITFQSESGKGSSFIIALPKL